MNVQNMRPVLAKIQAYSRIILFRHRRPDGDCLGSSKGLQRILQLTYPDKEVYLPESDTSSHLSFLGPDDPALPDEAYRDALGVVVDTGSKDRISNPKYALCRELVKIDHHPDVDPYAATSWVEEDCSSVCEMIAAFYEAFQDELKLDAQAATCLYLGLITDSGRFRFPGVDGDTLRHAALLLDAGVDTQRLYADLYLRDFESYRFQGHVYETLQRTEHGVAWLYISKEDQQRFGLSFEDACAAIGYLENIRGCPIWLAFIDAPDGAIRVRLRSRFVPISHLAEQFHGGGHAFASGATVYGQEEMLQLVEKADTLAQTL